MIDTRIVAQHFSDAATTYDEWAHPQRIVAKTLCNFLPQNAENILDLGCGTGIMMAFLREKYPFATLTGIDPAAGMIDQCRSLFAHEPRVTCVVSSAEEFIAPGSFDLIVATNSFQWVSDKRKALENIKRSLTTEGRCAMAIPLEKTLQELYESYHAATGTKIQYADLLTEDDYGSLFSKAGIPFEKSVAEKFQIPVRTPHDLILFLQKIGGAPPGLHRDSLLPEKELQRFVEHYTTQYSVDGGVAVTYHYLYGLSHGG